MMLPPAETLVYILPKTSAVEMPNQLAEAIW